MKIMEFIDVVKNNKNKMLKGDQLQELISKTIKVKDYLNIKEKKNLVDSIVNACILYEDGVFKFDEIDKYICFTMRTIEAYTNLELSDDIEEDYDALCKAKLLNSVIVAFNGEYENVKTLLQMKCDYICSSNSVESQFGRFFDNILDKVDVLSKALSDKVNSFNLNDLPIGAEDINKLISFLNVNK